MDAEPLELNTRGMSMTAVEFPGGSWTVGKLHSSNPRTVERIPDHSTQHGFKRTSDHSTHGGNRLLDHGAFGGNRLSDHGGGYSGNRVGDHGNRGVSLDATRRRNSLSMVGHDSAAIRSALGGSPLNIHAFAGVPPCSSLLPCILPIVLSDVSACMVLSILCYVFFLAFFRG